MNPSWRRDYTRYKSYFLNVVARYKERSDLKAYLEILLSLVTVSIFAAFALRPTLLTIAELTVEIEKKQETLETMNNKIQNISKAQNLYDRERNKITLLATSIPESPNVDTFVRQIEGLSGKYQVSISRISIGKATILGKQKTANSQEKTGNTIPETASDVSFSINTTLPVDQYSSLVNLLNDLEKMRRPIKINRLSFNTSKNDEQKTLTLAIGGKFPYLMTSSPH